MKRARDSHGVSVPNDEIKSLWYELNKPTQEPAVRQRDRDILAEQIKLRDAFKQRTEVENEQLEELGWFRTSEIEPFGRQVVLAIVYLQQRYYLALARRHGERAWVTWEYDHARQILHAEQVPYWQPLASMPEFLGEARWRLDHE